MIFSLEEGPVSQNSEFKQIFDSFYVTDSPFKCSRNGNVLFKLTSLNDFPLQEGPVSQIGEFKQSLDSFYVTHSPLSVTNTAERAMFYLNWPALMIFPLRKDQLVKLVSLNKVLTVCMLQIVL